MSLPPFLSPPNARSEKSFSTSVITVVVVIAKGRILEVSSRNLYNICGLDHFYSTLTCCHRISQAVELH